MMHNLSDDLLLVIVQGILVEFLSSYGMLPSEGGVELEHHGSHRIVVVQSKVPSDLRVDSYDMFCALSSYLLHHNALPTAVRLHPYNFQTYVCGGEEYCFISVFTST